MNDFQFRHRISLMVAPITNSPFNCPSSDCHFDCQHLRFLKKIIVVGELDPESKRAYRSKPFAFNIGSGGAIIELYADRHRAVPVGRLASAFAQSGHSDG